MEKNSKVIINYLDENIKDPKVFFVFPTQIAASMWARKTLEVTDVKAIAKERFIAWDSFKSSSIRSQQQNKTSIPSVMRSIFAEQIVKKNSIDPFFKEIILKDYAKVAKRFSKWIESILPSLNFWKNQINQNKDSLDNEDLDLLELYNRYKSFLDENDLFDPAWETPPFKDDGNKYIIFFPEILSDYSEYELILKSTPQIQIVSTEKIKSKEEVPVGYFFSNSRIELKEVVHYLWNIHQEKNIPWDKFAISVPDLESYGAYLQRELSLYQIPFVTKDAFSLASSGVGKLFSLIMECASDNFSYKSVKNLLLNRELPWIEQNVIDKLILFGKENNAICFYEYEEKSFDVWEESFKTPVSFPYDERIVIFYRLLKKLIMKIVQSKTFDEVRTNYFEFRQKFFDFESTVFPKESNDILSRCIAELGILVDLEERFNNCEIFAIDSHFEFFCTLLENTMYVPQSQMNGVNILPYRTACCAPFDVHVVLDASQSSTSITYQRLKFLRDDKRQKLGVWEDINPTEDFIQLYKATSQVDCLFTCAEKTFKGYSFVNSYLEEKDCRPKNGGIPFSFIKKDSYIAEKNWILNKVDLFDSEKLYKVQKDGFDVWKKIQSIKTDELSVDDSMEKFIYSHTKENDFVYSSATRLRTFFECPRKFLFNNLFSVKDGDNVATLIGPYTMGNINHSIMQVFLSTLKMKNLALEYNLTTNSILEEHKKILEDSINGVIEKEKLSFLAKEVVKTTKAAIKKNILETITNFSNRFNGYSVYEVEKSYKHYSKEKKYLISSRIDCILVSPEFDFVLIDFKNTQSAVPSNKYISDDESEVPDFQLPLYKYVVEKEDPKIEEISECMFYDLSASKEFVLYSTIGKLSDKRIDLNEQFENTQKVCLMNLEKFVECVNECNFSPDVVNVDYSVCSGCDYKSCCRRTFNVSKKSD